MPVYKKSELKIQSTGKKFGVKGMMLPFGTPLFKVIHEKHGRVYPPRSDGEPKHTCKRWIAENCWLPEDKPFPKSLLEKLARLEPKEKNKGITVVRNDLTYCGDRHNEHCLVFEEKGKYYQADYIDYFGRTCLGRWQKQSLEIDKNHYLCRRVYQKRIKVTLTEFVRREF